MKKSVVIGAGVAGLAAAIRLSCAGYAVDVFESNAFVGGKINSKNYGAYRFDMGPSVFTAPEYVKELYDLCGEDFSSFKYHKLETSFHYFYPDGSNFVLSAEQDVLIKQLAAQFGEEEKVIKKYLDKSASNYKLISPLFIESSLHRFRHLFNRNLFKALYHIPQYKLTKTMHEENKQTFRNPKAVQFFDRYATYNGSDPYQAPAMLNMIANLELNVGAFLPENGMVQITQSLYELAKKRGVKFHFEEKVEQILTANKKIVGIKTAKDTYEADICVSNMDVSLTFERLLAGEKQPKKILAQEKSSSAVVFYWGIKKEFPELGVHNIMFADDYKQEFDNIFIHKKLSADPTIYINITSKRVKNDAPEGGENWFVMVNAPTINGQDWATTVPELRQNLIDKINKTLKTNIAEYIETEDVMTPENIENWYSAKSGSIYGNASNNKYAAFYRHANFSKHIKGLYFVGVTVHPGGGIPLALNSAKIAVQCLKEDTK
jgi:phytoene desaturase